MVGPGQVTGPPSRRVALQVERRPKRESGGPALTGRLPRGKVGYLHLGGSTQDDENGCSRVARPSYLVRSFRTKAGRAFPVTPLCLPGRPERLERSRDSVDRSRRRDFLGLAALIDPDA